MADIFVSYAREDEHRVRPIVEALETFGWSVFWDTRLLPGDHWPSELAKELDASGCVLVVWSLTSVDAKLHHWVREEAEVGRKKGTLVPVQIDVVDPPFGFRHFHAADLSDWKNNTAHQAFRQLIGVINSKIPSSSLPPEYQLESEPEPRQGFFSYPLPGWVVTSIATAATFMLMIMGFIINSNIKVEPVVGGRAVIERTAPSPKALTIGDSYGGGKVVYLVQPDEPGYRKGEQHGLVVASADLSGRFTWNEAIKEARLLKHNGYSDWDLPDKEELYKLYLKRTLLGGFADGSDSFYWSSSESGPNKVWIQNFSNGYQYSADKSGLDRVRVVRAF